MILLPTKHLDPDRALLAVGALILRALKSPISYSELWYRVRKDWQRTRYATLSYDVFLLGLTLLYTIRAIEYRDGILWRSS